MSGGQFAAAYVGSYDHPILGSKVVVPDHKVYFVPMESEDEAAFLTGFLNSSLVSSAVAAYAAALSLGVSVVEYLLIPQYNPADNEQAAIVELAKMITAAGRPPTSEQLQELSRHVGALLEIPVDVLGAVLDVAEDVREAEAIASLR